MTAVENTTPARVEAQDEGALGEPVACPKCGFFSGDDWSHCGGVCPMPGSPHPSRNPERPPVAHEILEEEDPHEACSGCGDEHPEGVLDDGFCPSCCDEEEDDYGA